MAESRWVGDARHLAVTFLSVLQIGAAALAEDPSVDAQVLGMLIGSAIGDAAGGPVEFAKPEKVAGVLPGYRTKPDVRLGAADFRRLAETFPLLSYEKLRPDVASYGQWSAKAPAGTVTDDTRQKMVFMDALRRAHEENEFPLTRKSIAKALLRFRDRPEVRSREGWLDLCDDSFREFGFAARWELGERDPQKALPSPRMWSGLGTCCGQMMLPPLAGVFIGEPEQAYLAAYRLGFVDNGDGKDINATIIAGLAEALSGRSLGDTPDERHAAWREVLDVMKSTDPLRYGEIRFMKKPAAQWIDAGIKAAADADRSPAKLYQLIEEACPREHAWEARFLLTEVVALTEFCHGEPLAAMHLALDFGHDTDSAAQLMGAMFGALYWHSVFPKAMRDAVSQRLEADYGESVSEWVKLLRDARHRQSRGYSPVVAPMFGDQ